MDAPGLKARTKQVGEIIFSPEQKALIAGAMVLFAVLAFAPRASAAIVYNLDTSESEVIPISPGGIYYIVKDDVGLGLVEGFNLYLSSSGTTAVQVTMDCWTGSATSSMTATNSNSVTSTGGWYAFAPVSGELWDTSVCENGLIHLKAWNGGGSAFFLYGSAASVNDGYFQNYYGFTPEDVADLAFQMASYNAESAYATGYVELTSPNRSATTSSPVTLSADYYLPSSHYSLSDYPIEAVFRLDRQDIFGSTTPQEFRYLVTSLDAQASISTTTVLSSGTYLLEVMFEQNGSTLIYSDNLVFGVGDVYINGVVGSGYSGVIQKRLAMESCEASTDYSWWSALTAGSICKTGVYLFHPSVSFQDNYFQIKQEFERSFPFSVFYQLFGVFGSPQTSSSTEANLSLNYSGFNGIGATSTVIINKSWLRSIPLAATIRQYITYGLWILFGFILLWRISKIL